jgi:hypothetical protein
VVLISLEEAPELPASVREAGTAAYVRKQDLSTSTLRELWLTRRPGPRPAPGPEPSSQPPAPK